MGIDDLESSMTEGGPGNTRRSPQSRVWRAGLNLTALVLGLAICEAALHAAAALSPRVAFHLRPHDLKLNVDGNELAGTRELVPDPVLGYRFSPYSTRFDSWGYRNSSVPTACDIVALGDSMTFGHDVLAHQSWPFVLSQLHGSCVYNAGVGGYGPAEYQVVLSETLALRPKIVVVGLFLGNDMHDAFRATYLRAGEPFKHLRNIDPAIVLRVTQQEQHESLRQQTLRLLGLGAETAAPAAPGKGMRFWLAEHSKLYAFARELRRALRVTWNSARGDHASLPGEQSVETFDTSAAKPYRFGWSRIENLRTVFVKPELVEVSIRQGDPRIDEGERITGAVLGAMRQQLAIDNVHLVVLVIPTKESAYAELVDPQRDGLPASTTNLIATETRLRERIVGFLRKAQITYVDALPALRGSLANGTMAYNESDDGHPNAAGQRAMALALLPTIRDRLATSVALSKD